VPGPAPVAPAALHLLRLARVTPDQAVLLPGTGLRALHLTTAQAGPAGGAVICLDGELIVDLAGGAFVRLRAGEACALSAAHSLLPVLASCTVLLSGEGA
jgi:hypothetical protein